MTETLNPQVQGAAFESTLARLLNRLLADHLRYEDVSCTRQGSGLQYGKDLRVKWTDDGRRVVWHVECKSHGGKTIPGKEIADKLLDVARSAEQVDVWCLASANAEPSPWIHETFAWADRDLRFPFALAQLTPDQGDLRLLYALDETLFAEQYPTLPLPTLDEEERERILRAFERFLRAQTTRGDAAKLRDSGTWQLVSPATVRAGEDSPGRAALYLKGLVATAPWEAAVHGWAAPRTSAVRELARRVVAAGPGLDFVWLVGGAGEGKSTVLRQLAWTVAQRHDRDWYVLWSDRYMREQGTSLPVEFIERLRDGARVLVCLDDSAGVEGGERLRRAADEWRHRDVRVVLVAADRGLEWSHSELRNALSRGTPPGAHRQDLEHLTADEATALVKLLDDRSLLHEITIDEAAAQLAASASAQRRPQDGDEPTSYLLPLLLRFTDPRQRGHESILRDLLWRLAEPTYEDALALLLTASLTHAAGIPLSESRAAHVVPPGPRTDRAMVQLTAEIERAFTIPADTFESSGGHRALLTHHPVLADGFIVAATGAQELETTVTRLARDLPASLRDELDEERLAEPQLFMLLEAVQHRLLARRDPLFPVAVAWMEGWEELVPVSFPLINRLGRCRVNWLSTVLRRRPPDLGLAAQLVAAARADYRRSLTTARQVLGGSVRRPSRFAYYDLETQERVAFHGWAVVESIAGRRLGESDALWRSIYLALLSLAHDDQAVERALATLAVDLLELGWPNSAAQLVSASLATRGHDVNVTRHLTRDLMQLDVTVPAASRRWAHLAIGAIVPVLLGRIDELRIFATPLAHLDALGPALDRALVIFEPNTGIVEAKAAVEAARRRALASA